MQTIAQNPETLDISVSLGAVDLVSRAIQAQAELELALTALVRNYEKRTGMVVNEIDMDTSRWQEMGKQREKYVRTKVGLSKDY